MSTKVNVRIRCAWTGGIHATVPLTAAVHSLLFYELNE